MKVFTIGYGGRAPTAFVALLQQHGVRSVADVRLVPQRAALGSYVKARSPERGIEALLAAAGIGYAWLEELGNPYRFDADWPARYAALLARDGRRRVQPLLELAQPICLLCAEKRSEACHRALIAELLAADGHAVEHIV